MKTKKITKYSQCVVDSENGLPSRLILLRLSSLGTQVLPVITAVCPSKVIRLCGDNLHNFYRNFCATQWSQNLVHSVSYWGKNVSSKNGPYISFSFGYAMLTFFHFSKQNTEGPPLVRSPLVQISLVQFLVL